MNYIETIDYLYTRVPMFQRKGASAYKPGLDTSVALDNYLGNPHKSYPTIHVGGTNGKGSTSHLLAAILQQAGYRVGLYTSPHLVDFRERMRVNGVMIAQEDVVDFVQQHQLFVETLSPSFFELTMAMAFDYFRSENVDIAIVEVGLGGRLDSTNIIDPILSVITNISLDHTQYLGSTTQAIAAEKAGIIKEHTPVVIGSATGAVKQLFLDTATSHNAPIYFANEQHTILKSAFCTSKGWRYFTANYGTIQSALPGLVQIENAQTVLTVVRCLLEQGFSIPLTSVSEGFENVLKLTHLMGRWQVLDHSPKVVCDTGHNIGGMEYIVQQLSKEAYQTLHIVLGMVKDKDIVDVLAILPKDAHYYFTRATIERALPETALAELASAHNLQGTVHATVREAVCAAKEKAATTDLIFIGGSTFVVAEWLEASGISMEE
jgi:dihydrofolate synthase/folylpolyglutamate synthase